MTPRSMAEPGVNELLATMLPSPATVVARVNWRAPDGAVHDSIVTQTDIGVQPIDLVQFTAPAPADPSLFLPATMRHQSASAPLEEVVLMRDELANMVWGIERVVPLATDVGRRGAEQIALAPSR